MCGEFQPRRNLCLNPGQERGPRLQERKVAQGDQLDLVFKWLVTKFVPEK